MEQDYRTVTGHTKEELKGMMGFFVRMSGGQGAAKSSVSTVGITPKVSTVYDETKKLLYRKVGRKVVWTFDGDKLIVK